VTTHSMSTDKPEMWSCATTEHFISLSQN